MRVFDLIITVTDAINSVLFCVAQEINLLVLE